MLTVLSFDLWLAKYPVLIREACSAPVSRLQEPEMRIGRALYRRVSPLSTPSAPTVA